MQQRVFEMRNMQVRAENGARCLEGYFAVFDKPYQVCENWIETIAPGAFTRWLADGGDTKVLWNHDHNLVLGSTANNTASLRQDDTGLWGANWINEKDQDAVNAHARVERGDVNGCSFGFEVARQEEWWEGDVFHTKILEVYPLYEVSPCTFPAYPQTSITARAALEDARERFEAARRCRTEQWRSEMMRRLRGE